MFVCNDHISQAAVKGPSFLLQALQALQASAGLCAASEINTRITWLMKPSHYDLIASYGLYQSQYQ